MKLTKPSKPNDSEFESLKRGLNEYNESFTGQTHSETVATFSAEETRNTVEYLQGESVSHPDPADTAAANADRRMELRTKDRLRKLTNQIDKALRRIENGTYGYCKETGDPIRLERLDARPIAKLSIEAQEMHERSERLQA